MVIVLSAFNGIDQLVKDLYNTLEADIAILPTTGKHFELSTEEIQQVRQTQGVISFHEVVEDQALLRFNGLQQVATIKGVDTAFIRKTGLTDAVNYGEPVLEHQGHSMAIIGGGLADRLEIPVPEQNFLPLDIYTIPKGKSIAKNRENSFSIFQISIAGFFSINADYDTRYCVVPLSFARKSLGLENEVTSYELMVANPDEKEGVKSALQQMLPNHIIQLKEEKNEAIFQTAKTEKWITSFMLFFILLIAAFNIFASLTMLIIDKKYDLKTLRSLGLNRKDITRIFFFQSLFINGLGLVIGLGLGLLVCWLQITFGLVGLGGGVVEYYPIKILFSDLGLIALMIATIALMVYPGVNYLTKRLLPEG